jgi:hypothetical protein
MGTDDYQEENHPELKSLNIETCYICDKPLKDPIDSDHIIPDHFFRSSDGHRPQLPVHHKCNNSKSLDDEFAVLQIQAMCSLNKDAEASLLKFLKKAESEKSKEFLVGKSKEVRNLRLAKTMFQKAYSGLDFVYNGEVLTSYHNPSGNSSRLNDYIKQLAKGLFIRNVPSSSPGLPSKITWIPYDLSRVRGDYDKAITPIMNIINKSGADRFCQVWPGRVLYYGSHVAEDINKGYVFIEFYEKVGILVLFGDVGKTNG